MFELTDARSDNQQPGREPRERSNEQAIASPRSRHWSWFVGLLATLMAAAPFVGAAPAEAATTIETMSLWRLQVRITTGSNVNEGTDGHPAIRFNSSSTGVRTLNPQSKAAFDRGHIDKYDLRLLDSAKQIQMLRIGIASDRWCIAKLELLLNNRVAFADTPRDSPFTLRDESCVEPGTNLEYSSFQLRHNSEWLEYGTPPSLPHGLGATNLRRLVSSVTGSAMLATPEYQWNRSVPVSITRRTSYTFRVTFGILVLDPNGRKPLAGDDHVRRAPVPRVRRPAACQVRQPPRPERRHHGRRRGWPAQQVVEPDDSPSPTAEPAPLRH
jgi:hypothetical protein